jgi:hypothetical protein
MKYAGFGVIGIRASQHEDAKRAVVGADFKAAGEFRREGIDGSILPEDVVFRLGPELLQGRLGGIHVSRHRSHFVDGLIGDEPVLFQQRTPGLMRWGRTVACCAGAQRSSLECPSWDFS